MVTMAAPDDAVVEVVGAGMVGPDEEPPPPHPHAAKTKIARLKTRERMLRHYASRMPPSPPGIVTVNTRRSRAMLTEAVRAYAFQLSSLYFER